MVEGKGMEVMITTSKNMSETDEEQEKKVHTCRWHTRSRRSHRATHEVEVARCPHPCCYIDDNCCFSEF